MNMNSCAHVNLKFIEIYIHQSLELLMDKKEDISRGGPGACSPGKF